MAYVKITDLNFAQTLTGNEVLPVVQAGTSYQLPVSSIKGGLLIDPRSSVQGYCSTIVSGTSSRVDGNRSAIIGGYQNFTTGDNSIVIAGSGNDINSIYSGNLIVGGFNHEICGTPLTGCSLFGGYFRCDPEHNSILGGSSSSIKDGLFNGILNSSNSIIDGEAPNFNSIIASFQGVIETHSGGSLGNGNVIVGSVASSITSGGCIPGGSPHPTHTSADKVVTHSSIMGGQCHHITGSSHSAIIGGMCHSIIQTDKTGSAVGVNNVILGGFGHTLSGRNHNAMVGGSCNFILSGNDSAGIIGGFKNEIGNKPTDDYFFGSTVENIIVGGRYNRTHLASTVIGGNSNYSAGYRSTVIGGCKNCINVCGFDAAGNCRNIGFSTGQHSTIVGGLSNTITTSGAFIAGGFGNSIKVGHDHSAIIGTGITSVSGCMLHANTLFLSAAALPTSDPGLAGVVWRDGTDLKISI